MTRPPPRSTRTDTLLPYTTLFRAYWACLCRRVHKREGRSSRRSDQPAHGREVRRGHDLRPASAQSPSRHHFHQYRPYRAEQRWALPLPRSAERRVGKEWVSTGRYRWSPCHIKKKKTKHRKSEKI